MAADPTRTWEGSTPTGSYVCDRLHLSEPVPVSRELIARRVRLEESQRVHKVGGHLVGDGAESAEGASAEERARLGGRGPDGLPTGLRRRSVCRKAAGLYLRAGVEVVRLYCACENHNRCARGVAAPLSPESYRGVRLGGTGSIRKLLTNSRLIADANVERLARALAAALPPH